MHKKQKLVVVGLGHAWKEMYEKTVAKLQADGILELIGTVDPNTEGTGSGWHVRDVHSIPLAVNAQDTVVMVLTPDHFSVITALAINGFRKILCEKPLVSRMKEIPMLQHAIEQFNLQLYAIDFYLPKTFPLQVVRGLLGPDDPRYAWMTISDPNANFAEMLGNVEGVSVEVIEAGKFCLPDLQGRPYLATDKEIGGMILDLITHAVGPLENAGLLPEWTVCDASLARLRHTLHGDLFPVRDTETDVEMYASALLDAGGIPLHLAFGKVPIGNGGVWALTLRGTKGMYYAGLRTGQPSVLLANDGRAVIFSLTMTTYEAVIREAFLYFEGLLPGFDGNYGAFLTSRQVGAKILEKYWQRTESNNP